MGIITFPFGASDLSAALKLINRVEGAYGVGQNSFWHGGIHLNSSSDTEAIVAPVKGEIIAHRTMKSRTLGKKSISVDDQGNKVSSEKEENFDSSYSFVLTRHTLETPKQQTITFYMLHMHLLCYENYQDLHKLRPPPYLHSNIQYFINTEEDKGGDLVGDGIKLRSQAVGKINNVVTVVKKGTEVVFKDHGQYDHAQPKSKYLQVEIKNPTTFKVDDAYVLTGLSPEGQLRLWPKAQYYSTYGLLYRCQIISCSEDCMGVPLYINGQHVGDLLKGQKIYLRELPQDERRYSLILDNIAKVILPGAEGELSSEGVGNWLSGEGGWYTPKSEEIVSLQEAIEALYARDDSIAEKMYGSDEQSCVDHARIDICASVSDMQIEAFIVVRKENEKGIAGEVKYLPEKLSSFEIRSFEDNECGVPAFSNKSKQFLINIPYGRELELAVPITIDEVVNEKAVAIKPLSVKQPSEGYIYCGKGYIEQKINDVTGKFDVVEVLREPIEIYGGQIIGYPGSHARQNTIHVEMWLDNIDFFDNPKMDLQYPDGADLPAGIPIKVKVINTWPVQPAERSVPAGTEMRYVAKVRGKNDGGSGPGLRKVKFSKPAIDSGGSDQENEYYVYYSDLENRWSDKKKRYCFPEETGINLYRNHPDELKEEVELRDGSLAVAKIFSTVPAMTVVDDENFYPIEVRELGVEERSENGVTFQVSVTHVDLVSEQEFNKYRGDNLFDWGKYFRLSKAEELGFEVSGFNKSKDEIGPTVLKDYSELTDSKEMAPAPDYQSAHPLSHLVIQNGTDWSNKHKNQAGWAEAVIEHMWKEASVSSIEESMGINQDAVKKIFDQTIKPYSEQIAFYDEVKSSYPQLPAEDAIWHVHPIRFLNHLNQLNFDVLVRYEGKPVPFFSQGDSDWGSEFLTTKTIISKGCALTSVAMILKYYGRNVDPKKLDAHLDSVGGYNGNSLYWDEAFKFQEEGEEIKIRFGGYYSDSDESITKISDEIKALIDSEIMANRPVIASIDHKGDGTFDGVHDHFAVIVGKRSDGQYILNDPATYRGNGVQNPSDINTIQATDRKGGYNLVRVAPIKIGQ